MSFKYRRLKFQVIAPDPRLRDFIVGYFLVNNATTVTDPLLDKAFPSCSESLVTQLGNSITAKTSLNKQKPV